jgi:hypothetical protein
MTATFPRLSWRAQETTAVLRAGTFTAINLIFPRMCCSERNGFEQIPSSRVAEP